MSILLNLIWLVFGGFFICLGYFVGGLALCLTVVGIPWGLQCFKLAMFAIWPFDLDTKFSGEQALGGVINVPLNIIWLIFGGLWVVFHHIFWGVILCITIVGIPFGVQHFKMVKLGIWPFGRVVVEKS